MLQLVSGTGVKAPRFKDLRVRPKLIVLHNTFFFILACVVYYSVIPLVEEYVATSRQRDTGLLGEMLLERREPLPFADFKPADRVFGSAQQLAIPELVRRWLDAHPGEIRFDPAEPDFLYRLDRDRGEYGRLQLDPMHYEQIVSRARLGLFVSLGAIYLLAVAMLELVVMPRYVYQPIRAHLEADRAIQSEDRLRELIPAKLIPGDEVGDIMRSRNATVSKLREKEIDLERALARQAELTQDLRWKNQQLESAKRGMAAQDRLATIGLLSASVAHEINTPLAVMSGTIEKLGERLTGPQAGMRLARIRKMTERLRRISEGLLDFSRARRSEERKPVVVRDLVEEAWSLIALDQSAAGVEFENRIAGELRVLGDYDRLMQVFVNLLRNGMYAVDGVGRIEADASRIHDSGRSWVAIQVDDDGPGIPEDVLPNIFEAFVSTRLDSRGTGLGLTVADGIVEQHGGRTSAFNRAEGGARLEVRLPAV